MGISGTVHLTSLLVESFSFKVHTSPHISILTLESLKEAARPGAVVIDRVQPPPNEQS